MSAPVEHYPCRCAVLPVADPVAIDHLDEDWAVPCERRYEPNCGSQNPAEWIVYYTRCCPEKPVFTLWCTPCMKRVMARKCKIRCPRCGLVVASVREAYVLIEPLNRRTT
jgi:hypothetical protein